MFPRLSQNLWALLMFVATVQAQFNFFDHMFGGNQQQQRNQGGSGNAPSDSGRYQHMWSQCMLLLRSNAI